MNQIISQFLNIEPIILLPIIILIISLIIKMDYKKAILSALTLAIAFVSIGLVINFMFELIGPVTKEFVKKTNLNLNIIDLGFSPMVAISFAWPLAIFLFPLQIIINILMIHFNYSNVLNVDIFNIWGKIFTAALVSSVSKNIFFGFIAAIIQIILELLISEKLHNRIQRITGIPNTTTTHVSLLQSPLMLWVEKLIDKISFLKNIELDCEHLKNKIGLLGEESIMGFILGMILTTLSNYTFYNSLLISIKLASCLILLPIISKIFIQALNPISEAAKEFMKNKYKNRDISIGLDWPILAGAQELWIVSMLLIPITLILAIIFAKLGISNILPLPGIVNIVVVIPALIIANRDILKMLILTTIFTPFYLITSTYFAKSITELSRNSQIINLGNQELISYYSLEAPIFRMGMAKFFNFETLGVIILIIYVLSLIYFIKNKEI